MKNYTNLVSEHLAIDKSQDEIMDRLRKRHEMYESRLASVDKKMKKAREKQKYWIDTFVKPLANELQKKFRDRHIKILGPFGIRSSVSIHLVREETNWMDKSGKERDRLYEKYFAGDNIIDVTIIPADIGEGIFHYESGEQKESYRKGTIGEVNGCNNVTKEIKSLNTLLKHLKSQQKRKAK